MQYKVTFEKNTFIYNEKQLRNFIDVAVIRNKDISKFSIERIDR